MSVRLSLPHRERRRRRSQTSLKTQGLSQRYVHWRLQRFVDPGLDCDDDHRRPDRRFSVVTTLDISVPVLEADSEQSLARIAIEIGGAFDADDVQSAVLACAGMADLAERLTVRYNRPAINGVAAAVGFCETAWATTRALATTG